MSLFRCFILDLNERMACPIRLIGMETLCGRSRRGLAMLLAGVILSAAACGEEEESRGAPAAGTLSSEANCDFPSREPTYLPWAEGRDVPDPLEDRFEGSAQLFWDAPRESRWDYLRFAVTTDVSPGRGENADVTYEGEEGSFAVGSDHFTVTWSLRGSHCNLVELTLKIRGEGNDVTVEEGKQEIREVARSL